MDIQSAQIRKYWQSFNKKRVLIPIIEYLAFFTGLIVVNIINSFNFLSLNFILSWLILTIIYVLFQIIRNIQFILPQKKILDIILNQTFNRQIVNNPVIKDDESSGFNGILNFLYLKNNNKEDSDIDKPSKFSILDESQVGVIVLDENSNTIYQNINAPNLENLAFTNQPNPKTWIKKVKEHKISSFKVWQRIPEQNTKSEKQRFFDIFADFRKANDNQTILFIFDKTNEYTEDEDDLNFIAFAAHELRGPITIIRGYLDVLNMELGDSISKTHKELLDRMSVSGNKLSGYINNILNVSRLDQNRLSFNLTEHKIKEIIDSCHEDIMLRASSQNRILDINIPKNLPTVGTDMSGMSEVFINLVDNAIKYSNEGGLVKIYAKENGDFVDLSIQDFGIGIPAIVLSNLFQKFYRSHRSRETVAGTGIGLYISQAIAHKIGGNISVTSIEGEGSTFTISIPIYEKIKDKLLDENASIIKQPGGGWIKNHGRIK